jgi:hypothetical protein
VSTNILSHLKSLEAIAFAHPSHSRSVLNAYNASAEYVMKRLREETDCQLSTQAFRTPIWTENSPPTFRLLAPFPVEFQPLVDFRAMRYGGDSARLLNATLVKVDNYGCDMADYAVFPKGSVALVQESAACQTWNKTWNAEKAGASAVLVYPNENRKSSSPSFGRARVVNWQEGDALMSIPVFSLIYSVGSLLSEASEKATPASSVTVSITANSTTLIANTFNVICETREGDDSSTVMVGAHLDSVPEGPGMVDNGSGSSAILEVFLQMYRTGLNKKLENKMRFAWWAAEEIGLLGSRHYARALQANETEYSKVALYVNHDMLASPNGVPMVSQSGLVSARDLSQATWPDSVVLFLNRSTTDRRLPTR